MLILNVYYKQCKKYLEGVHALCVLRVCACAVHWGVFDLLGEVAAKSSYSKVLVGECSGRLP